MDRKFYIISTIRGQAGTEQKYSNIIHSKTVNYYGLVSRTWKLFGVLESTYSLAFSKLKAPSSYFWNRMCSSYLFIYLFIYLYFSSFFPKFDICKVKRIWRLAKSNTCDFENFQHSQRYTHVRSNSHICTRRTLLMPRLTFFTICKRRICNISHKFMIKVKLFPASKKSGAIMYK